MMVNVAGGLDLTLRPGEKISRAIVDLQKEQPFFAHLLMHMRPQVMPKEFPMQTAGVDARGTLYYAEEYFEKLKMEEVRGVLCHEVLHVALQHVLRVGTRNRIISNVAQDVAVNNLVLRAAQDVQALPMVLPKGGIPVDLGSDTSKFPLCGVQIKIEDVSEKSWEVIYGDVLDQLRQKGKNPDGASRDGVGFDEHVEGDGGEQMSEEELQREAQKWRQAIAAAANYAKQQGKLPAGMERHIEDLLKPRMPWKALLLRYLKQHTTPVDWSYHKPNRKSYVLDVYMPNVIKECCEVEVIVDTSGSIAGKELTEFLTEIVGIAQSMSHVRMWVTFVDAKVQNRYEVSNGDIQKILAMTPQGGGGTRMEIGLDYVKEHNRTVPVVVVLTDGCDSWSRSRKDYPFEVIWCLSEGGISESQARSQIPYGVKVKM